MQFMQSGDLKHRIEWQVQTKVLDGIGGFTVTWIAVPGIDTTHPNAAIWGVKGNEQLEGGRTVAVMTKRVRIRWRRIFNTLWRGKDLCHFNGKYLSIVTAPVDLGDEHKWLELYCKEVI